MSLHPYLTLALIRLYTTSNRVKDFLHLGYKGFLELLSSVSYIGACACLKDSCPKSQIISSRRSPISTSTGSDWDPLYKSINSPCHIHVVYFFLIPSHKICFRMSSSTLSFLIQTIYTRTKIFFIFIQSILSRYHPM